MEQAEAIFAQPKRRGGRTKAPIGELGPHPETGVPVRVLDGRFGPYVTDGTINATVPRGVDPASIDIEQGVELSRARGPGPAQKRTTKKAAKKTTKKAAKKSPAKRSSTAKTPPKTTTRVVKKGTSSRAKAAKAATKKATARTREPGRRAHRRRPDVAVGDASTPDAF